MKHKPIAQSHVGIMQKNDACDTSTEKFMFC